LFPPFSFRYFAVVGKSPLDRGCGNANSGGHFGAYMKFAGYNAVFFIGISEKTVYLFINNGKAGLKFAEHKSLTRSKLACILGSYNR